MSLNIDLNSEIMRTLGYFPQQNFHAPQTKITLRIQNDSQRLQDLNLPNLILSRYYKIEKKLELDKYYIFLKQKIENIQKAKTFLTIASHSTKIALPCIANVSDSGTTIDIEKNRYDVEGFGPDSDNKNIKSLADKFTPNILKQRKFQNNKKELTFQILNQCIHVLSLTVQFPERTLIYYKNILVIQKSSLFDARGSLNYLVTEKKYTDEFRTFLNSFSPNYHEMNIPFMWYFAPRAPLTPLLPIEHPKKIQAEPRKTDENITKKKSEIKVREKTNNRKRKYSETESIPASETVARPKKKLKTGPTPPRDFLYEHSHSLEEFVDNMLV